MSNLQFHFSMILVNFFMMVITLTAGGARGVNTPLDLGRQIRYPPGVKREHRCGIRYPPGFEPLPPWRYPPGFEGKKKHCCEP